MKRLLALALGLALLALLSKAARSDPRTSFLAEQLRSSDDYRVRTQAALALGSSSDDAAVRPLCDALVGDSNVAVRAIAAAALGKLGKQGGASCLKDARAKEPSSAVKSQIDKALGMLQNVSGTGPPPPGPDAKYYVAIDVTNKTPRAEIESIVRTTMQSKLLAKSGFAVAPKGEAPAQGGQVVKEKRLKGFLLLATVERPLYERGSLTQVVRVSMVSYPGGSVMGEVAPKLTQTQTSKGDVESENRLIKMCAENAIESFQRVAATL